MIAYKKDEIISIAHIAGNLNEILEKLKSGTLEKVAISKNNRLESVILPIEEYETLQEVYDMVEHMEICKLIKERETEEDLSREEALEKIKWMEK